MVILGIDGLKEKNMYTKHLMIMSELLSFYVIIPTRNKQKYFSCKADVLSGIKTKLD